MTTLNRFTLLLVFLLAACGPSRVDKTISPAAIEQSSIDIATKPNFINPTLTSKRPSSQNSEPTYSVTEIVVVTDTVRSEKIFHWNYRGGYGSFELDDLYTSFLPIVPKPKNIPQPIEVDGWLFASQKEETAFLYRNAEGILELWNSDMNLDHPRRLWVDEKNWLGPENMGWRISSFKWGPGENSMLIKRLDNQMVVYSYSEQQAFLFPDGCNWLTQSPFSGKWGQVCKAGDRLLILEVDGKLRPLSIKETAPLIETIAQSIFYDGSRAVFVDPNYQFIEVDASGEKRALPVYWTEGVMASVNSDTTWLTPLQWTKSGERVLVYAYSLQQEDCPYRRNQEGELRPDPCWLLLENGKIVWHLQREKLEELDLNWDNLYTNFEAAISPQDDAIILVISDMPVDFVLLSYFEDGNVEFLLNGEMDKIVWKLIH